MANRDLAPWTRSRGIAPFARDPFTSFRQQMERLFDDFLAPIEAPASSLLLEPRCSAAPIYQRTRVRTCLTPPGWSR